MDDDAEAEAPEDTSGPSTSDQKEDKRPELKRTGSVSREKKPEVASPAKATTGSSEIFAGKTFLFYGPFDLDERQELSRSKKLTSSYLFIKIGCVVNQCLGCPADMIVVD